MKIEGFVKEPKQLNPASPEVLASETTTTEADQKEWQTQSNQAVGAVEFYLSMNIYAVAYLMKSGKGIVVNFHRQMRVH